LTRKKPNEVPCVSVPGRLLCIIRVSGDVHYPWRTADRGRVRLRLAVGYAVLRALPAPRVPRAPSMEDHRSENPNGS
ncbi:hypothetical protein XPU_0740, partial [Xanthomonas arboricola pv. pruni str. MAFF 311562]